MTRIVLACIALATAAHAQPPAPPTVKPPVLVQDAAPVYPPKALEERVHAVVVVALEISETGTVTNATVASSTVIPETGAPRPDDGRYDFGAAATEAAKRLVFAPAEYGGKPYAVQIDFTYRFTLPPRPPEPVDAAPPRPAKPSIVNYRGTLLERGTRSNVPGALVTVFREEGGRTEGFEATSSADGTFQFYDLPPGRWTVRIEREGYVTTTTDETLSETEVVDGRYWIEKGSYSPYDVTIEAERPRKEVNRRSLSADVIAKVPGPIANDPVLVTENLPSVARSLGGDIIVRGSGPEDTGVFVNGIGVPLIYHFGGLKSVLPGNVVGGIDFYPGNFSVAYGRAMGGVLDLQLKKLAPDRVRGAVDTSVLDTSLYLEVPLGKTAAIAAAGRRSYVDYILAATIPEDSGIGLVSAPRYYDYQLLGNWRPSRAQEVRWLALGSDDLFELLFDDPADPSGIVESNELTAQTSFVRAIADHRYTPDRRFSNLLRLSAGRDDLFFSIVGAFKIDSELLTFQARDTATWTLGDRLAIDAGLDLVVTRFTGTLKLPPIPAEGQPREQIDPDDIQTARLDSDPKLDAAPFVEARVTLGKLALVPGLRVDYFGATRDVTIDPRISARYQLSGCVAAKAGAAAVHQAPNFFEIDPVFGNPDLGVQLALQYSAGVEWKPNDVIKIDATAFYKDMRDLVSPTDRLVERDGRMVPARYDNGGVGRVYGAELFVEHAFSNNVRGWLSYTLSRAERRDSGADAYRRFDYDQPHILAIVGAYALPRHWELGLRWRLVSGNPDTPVVAGILDSATDEYQPVYGPVNSDRLPLFYQLDLRVDKTFVFDTWKLAAYLSVINATNRRNVERRTYNFDYTEKGAISGLPVLPVFGVRGEW